MNYKAFIDYLEKNNRKVVLFFFIALLVLGCSVYKDYGISWDEFYQWKSNGHVNYNFIFHDEKEALLNGADKYHGPAFELVLVGVEKLFHLSDNRSIFLMRHLMCFLVFYLGALFFYFLALRIFNDWKIALLGFLMYVLSPHIFSHAFYNSKDTVFLSFFTISIFTLFWFLEKRTVWRAVLFSLITAFTIDVRIIGILIPLFLFYLLIVNFFGNRFKRNRQTTLYVIVYCLALVLGIILFWPVLWLDPTYHFMEALKENSKYPWDAPVLYFGRQYTPTTLPWHYIYFWMFVSRPLIYSILFIVGALTLLWKFIRKPFRFVTENPETQIVLFWFFVPLLAMLLFKSPAFDTGRHLYFLHGAFVLISVYGLQQIIAQYKQKRAVLFGFAGLLLLSLGGLIFRMVQLHPYEHLYFNETQSTDLNQHKRNFEFDYWGLSARDILQHLVKSDISKRIVVQAENLPGELNAYLLPKEDRERLVFTKNLAGARYFLADYRWRNEEDYPYKTVVYSSELGNAKLSTLFKLYTMEELSSAASTPVLTYNQNFEQPMSEWQGGKIVEVDSASHSGAHATQIDGQTQFSQTLVLTNMKALVGNKKLVLKTSFWVLDPESESNSKFAISMETKEGKSYFWNAINELKNTAPTAPQWKEIKGAIELPAVKQSDDQLKVYLMNVGKTKVLMDDVKIEFVELK